MSTGKLALGWTMGAAGTVVTIISILRIIGNYLDMGPHSCFTPPPRDSVCGSYLWIIGGLTFFALLGGALMIAGPYLASSPGKSTAWVALGRSTR